MPSRHEQTRLLLGPEPETDVIGLGGDAFVERQKQRVRPLEL